VPDFAELLKTFREAAGLSQRSLARASEINPAIISRMESGDRGPSGPAQVLAIARLLADKRLSKRDRERFRRVISLLTEQWAATAAADASRPEATS
jgi:transcriptional regulator with XRE-family HTH domain